MHCKEILRSTSTWHVLQNDDTLLYFKQFIPHNIQGNFWNLTVEPSLFMGDQC
jgi:hypothetical protein